MITFLCYLRTQWFLLSTRATFLDDDSCMSHQVLVPTKEMVFLDGSYLWITLNEVIQRVYRVEKKG